MCVLWIVIILPYREIHFSFFKEDGGFSNSQIFDIIYLELFFIMFSTNKLRFSAFLLTTTFNLGRFCSYVNLDADCRISELLPCYKHHEPWMFIILLQSHKEFKPTALQLYQQKLVSHVTAFSGSEYFLFFS